MIKNLEDLKNICKQLPKKGKYQISCSTEQYKTILGFMILRESEPVLEIDSGQDITDLIGIKMMGYELVIQTSKDINSANKSPHIKQPLDYYIEEV